MAVATNGALSDLSKRKERDGEEGGVAGDEISNSKAVAATSTDVASVNGGSSHFLQVRMFMFIRSMHTSIHCVHIGSSHTLFLSLMHT